MPDSRGCCYWCTTGYTTWATLPYCVHPPRYTTWLPCPVYTPVHHLATCPTYTSLLPGPDYPVLVYSSLLPGPGYPALVYPAAPARATLP